MMPTQLAPIDRHLDGLVGEGVMIDQGGDAPQRDAAQHQTAASSVASSRLVMTISDARPRRRAAAQPGDYIRFMPMPSDMPSRFMPMPLDMPSRFIIIFFFFIIIIFFLDIFDIFALAFMLVSDDDMPDVICWAEAAEMPPRKATQHVARRIFFMDEPHW